MQGARGAALARQHERRVLQSYRRAGDVWTIGYGHTGMVDGVPVHNGMTIDEATAERLFDTEDWPHAIVTAQHLVRVPLNDNELGALGSLVFNIGSGHFAGSTVLRLLNAGDRIGAAKAFGMWDEGHDGSGHQVVLAELVRRRADEKALFLTPAGIPRSEMPVSGQPSAPLALVAPEPPVMAVAPPQPPTVASSNTMRGASVAGIAGVAGLLKELADELAPIQEQLANVGINLHVLGYVVAACAIGGALLAILGRAHVFHRSGV